jgi:hypothetical protein
MTIKSLSPVVPVCIGCNKSPEELMEYVGPAAAESGDLEFTITATAWMVHNETTFQRFEKDKFYCTTCYIKAGMPLIQPTKRRK